MPFEIYKLGIQRTNLYWRGLGHFHRCKRFHRFGVSRRCVVKSRVRLLNWMTSTTGNETNDHCLKLITWPAFGSSLFFLKVENEKWNCLFIFNFFWGGVGGVGGGREIRLNLILKYNIEMNNEKWKPVFSCHFFRKLTNDKLKFVFKFHFFNESKHGKDFCAQGPFKGMNEMA